MHTNSSILRVQKETIKNLENAIQQLVKNFENLNSNKYAFHFVDKVKISTSNRLENTKL